MDLAVAHRGHGGERHVEGIEGGVVVDDGEAYRADRQCPGDGKDGDQESPD